MIVIPAVDIQEGKGVRLYQGDFRRRTIYGEDPVVLAERWEEEGAEFLHLVDLDGARLGKPVNREAVLKIRQRVRIPLEVGGGIRTLEDARSYLEEGIDQIVLGTVVCQNPDKFREIVEAYPGRVVVGIDAREGKVRVGGWQEGTEIEAISLAQRLKEMGGERIIYTDIKRDGTLLGPDLPTIRKFVEKVSMPVVLAGGISSVEHILQIKKLEPLGVIGVIIGKALYEGKVDFWKAREVAR